MHDAIARATNLDLNAIQRSGRRDSAFRDAVLSVWGHRCAFCGYNIQLDHADLGLEAAHVRWVQSGGPDAVTNGLACCSIHHLAFDRGAIGVSDNATVMVFQ